MTTYFPFVPSILAPFQFSPVLDGETCSASVPWSLFGRRYYVTVLNPDNTLMFSLPVIGSPAALSIQSIEWANGLVTVTTIDRHRFSPGTVAMLTVKGTTPLAYSGLWRCEVISVTQFTYRLQPDPGNATAVGQVSHDVNIAAGYSQTSRLVFRFGSQTFEVDP
jgi:hypothetical protein